MRAAALLAALALTGPAWAAEDRDWPCVQAKVPTLTPAAIWTGPVFEPGLGAWREDAEVAALVGRLSQRRLPLEEAEAEVEAFAAVLGPQERRDRLGLLFAGLFDTMNAERSDVMEGIERYARRQVAMAEGIRAESSALDARRGAADADPAAVAEAEEALAWHIRVFDERRASLTYVCEVPRLIEQRLFALGRGVSAALDE